MKTNTKTSSNKAATLAIILPTGMSLRTRDEIKADQDKIGTSITDLDKSVHDNAMQCLAHMAMHRDTSLMVRLIEKLTDTGYRVQGLIQWVRAHSPAELNGKTMNLSGRDPATGMERPFKLDEAQQTFFNKATAYREMVKPVFATGLKGKLNQFLREMEALSNTGEDGKPINPAKPFLIVDNVNSLKAAADKVREAVALMPTVDLARDRYMHQKEGERIEAEAVMLAEQAAEVAEGKTPEGETEVRVA